MPTPNRARLRKQTEPTGEIPSELGSLSNLEYLDLVVTG